MNSKFYSKVKILATGMVVGAGDLVRMLDNETSISLVLMIERMKGTNMILLLNETTIPRTVTRKRLQLIGGVIGKATLEQLVEGKNAIQVYFEDLKKQDKVIIII